MQCNYNLIVICGDCDCDGLIVFACIYTVFGPTFCTLLSSKRLRPLASYVSAYPCYQAVHQYSHQPAGRSEDVFLPSFFVSSLARKTRYRLRGCDSVHLYAEGIYFRRYGFSTNISDCNFKPDSLGLHEIRQVLQQRRPLRGRGPSRMRRESPLRSQRRMYRRHARPIVDLLSTRIVSDLHGEPTIKNVNLRSCDHVTAYSIFAQVCDELSSAEAERRRLRSSVRGRTTRPHGRRLQVPLHGLQRRMNTSTVARARRFVEHGFRLCGILSN